LKPSCLNLQTNSTSADSSFKIDPMKFVNQVSLLLFLLLSIGGPALAQKSKYRYEFGLGAGFTVYQGDLTPRRLGSFETQQFSLALQASRIMTASFSARASFVAAKLKGDDAVYEEPEFRQERNFFFISPVKELSLQLVWNITAGNYRDRGFSPYLFGGGGLALVKIRRNWSRINAAYFSESATLWPGLEADSVHRLPRILPVIPVGAGVKYFFKPNWAVNAEATYRFATTDYLDGFSESANPDKKDNFLSYTVGLIFRPGRMGDWKCPVIKY
jgi:Domain of unknown function (DUF6089)